MITEAVLMASSLLANSPDLVHEVICAETRFSRAAERKDKDAFISMVDPDARFVTSDISRGHEEIAAAWSFAFADDDTIMRWRPAVVEVTSDGALAISRGPYRLTGIDDEGGKFEVWGTFISTWRRNEDGQWRVLFDTSGENEMTPTADDIATLQSEPACGSE
jgi:ketosteroid isomerase-like protein